MTEKTDHGAPLAAQLQLGITHTRCMLMARRVYESKIRIAETQLAHELQQTQGFFNMAVGKKFFPETDSSEPMRDQFIAEQILAQDESDYKRAKEAFSAATQQINNLTAQKNSKQE